MIHFLPDSFEQPQALPETPYADALARLISIRHALGIVHQVAGTQSAAEAATSGEAAVSVGWPEAAPATQRAFDSESNRVAGSAVAGLEAIAAQQEAGRAMHPAALERLSRELSGGLAGIDRLFTL